MTGQGGGDAFVARTADDRAGSPVLASLPFRKERVGIFAARRPVANVVLGRRVDPTREQPDGTSPAWIERRA